MIEIIHVRENDDDFTVYFKIDIDGEIYEFHGDVPKGEDQQIWLEKKQDFIRFLILQKMYKEADWQRFKTDNNTRLEAMEAWIADGHKNQIQVETFKNGKPQYKYEVVEKQPWRSTHPPALGLEADIEALTINSGLKKVLKRFITQ